MKIRPYSDLKINQKVNFVRIYLSFFAKKIDFQTLCDRFLKGIYLFEKSSLLKCFRVKAPKVGIIVCKKRCSSSEWMETK